MKKTFASLAGLAALGGFIAWAGLAGAQQPGVKQASATTNTPAPAQRPGTAVAVVNMNYVLKNYQKAQALNNQIKARVQYYGNLMNSKKEEMAKKQAELTKPTTLPSQKDAIERDIVKIQRELQDLDGQARKEIGDAQGKIAIDIFKEIEGVIQAVAVANGFDLVLSYPDSTEKIEGEMYSQDNVVRKMASQAAIPIFYKPHVDLTSAVTVTLNAKYPAPPVTQATGGTPPAPPRP